MTTMQHDPDLLEQAPAAWRRPGVVFVMYAFRLVVALVVATPFALVLGAAVSGYPRADAVLFDDGGLMFVETMRRSSSAVPAAAMTGLLILAVASLASIMPLAALIGALGTKGRITARDVGAFALRPIGAFALLMGGFVLTQALVFALISGIGRAIARRPSFDAPTADGIKFGVTILAVLVVLLIGVVHDLARVAAVRDELGFRASVRRAWRTIKTAHVHVISAWAVRALLGTLAIYAALSIGSRLGVESGAKVFFGFLVYQAAILLALFLKASWFASAIRHVDRTRAVITAEPEAPVETEVTAAVNEAPALTTAPEDADATNPDDASADLEPSAAENSGTPDNLDAHA